MVVFYFLHTWDSWLCDFWAEVRIRLRSCTPSERLWVKQQKRSSLSTCRTSTLCSFFLGYKTLWRQFGWESLSTLPSRHACTQVLIDPAGYCFCVHKSIWILRLLCFSEWNQRPDSFLLHITNCWKNGQVSRSQLFRWEFPLRNWIPCVSPFQVPNPPRNVDKNATLLSTCDHQHLPLCVPHPHLLFLIRSALCVECFHVDVKRKILETLESKVYTWRWHQVLGRCAP